MKGDLMQYELSYWWVASILRHLLFKKETRILNSIIISVHIENLDDWKIIFSMNIQLHKIIIYLQFEMEIALFSKLEHFKF